MADPIVTGAGGVKSLLTQPFLRLRGPELPSVPGKVPLHDAPVDLPLFNCFQAPHTDGPAFISGLPFAGVCEPF